MLNFLQLIVGKYQQFVKIMKLLSKRLQIQALALLLCTLLLAPVWGAVSAYADDSMPMADANDDDLERLRLSQCVFTIVDGEVYWMSLTEEELWEYSEYLKRELDINTAAAAGILVNIQFESGFDPEKEGDGGDAYGICQWRGERKRQMVKFCLDNDFSPSSMDGQLAFLVHDLKENYIYPYDLVRLTPNSWEGAMDAAYNFCAYYEVPADPDAESADRVELCDVLYYPALVDLEEF